MTFDLPSLRSVFQPSRRTRSDMDNMFDDSLIILKINLSVPCYQEMNKIFIHH